MYQSGVAAIDHGKCAPHCLPWHLGSTRPLTSGRLFIRRDRYHLSRQLAVHLLVAPVAGLILVIERVGCLIALPAPNTRLLSYCPIDIPHCSVVTLEAGNRLKSATTHGATWLVLYVKTISMQVSPEQNRVRMLISVKVDTAGGKSIADSVISMILFVPAITGSCMSVSSVEM